jgi:Domain of unknown function (DUF4389)
MERKQTTATDPRLIRALHLILLFFAFGVGQTVLGIITAVQFIWLLSSGETNQLLRNFGTSLAHWFAETVRYLTCASDEKPFPWKEWPAAD